MVQVIKLITRLKSTNEIVPLIGRTNSIMPNFPFHPEDLSGDLLDLLQDIYSLDSASYDFTTFTTLNDLSRILTLINWLDQTIVQYENFRPLRGGNFSTLCGHLFVFLDFLCSRTNKPREGILSWYDFRPYLFSIFSSTWTFTWPHTIAIWTLWAYISS